MKHRLIRTGISVIVLGCPFALCQQTTGQQAHSPSRKQMIEQADSERVKAAENVQSLSAEIDSRRKQIAKMSGLVSVTPESIRLLAEQLQTQKETLEIEEAGAQGRQEALVEAIDKMSGEVKKRIASNDVASELNKVIDVRQKQLDRLAQGRAAGAVSNEEVNVAEAALATARAEAAASRQRATSSSGEALDIWNRELMNLIIARKERAAKLDFIKHRLISLAPALDEARILELRLQSLAQEQKWLDAAIEHLHTVNEMISPQTSNK